MSNKKKKVSFAMVLLFVGVLFCFEFYYIKNDLSAMNEDNNNDIIAEGKSCLVYDNNDYANSTKYDAPFGPICGTYIDDSDPNDFKYCYHQEGPSSNRHYRKYNAAKGACKNYSNPTSSSTTMTTNPTVTDYRNLYVLIGPNDGTIDINTNVGSVTIYSSGKVVSSESGIGSQPSYKCPSGSACSATVAANSANGYIFVKWSSDASCSNNLGKGNPASFSAKEFGNVVACFAKKSTGGSTGGSSGGNTPVEEPPVVSNNEEVNSVYYAKGEGFSGSSIACGDKLYLTKCTKTNDPICNVSSINDKAVSNTQIRKSNIVKNQDETGCFQKIERYIAEKTYYYSDKGLSKDKTEIGCGSIVIFKKEIKK